MEKLIELINEHQKEIHPDGIYLHVVAYSDGIFFSDGDCLSWVIDEVHLISKNYGFISWLVENDKIDLDMVREKLGIPCCVWYGSGRIIAVKDVEYYKQVLMLLSISDSPIDDLILYLK